MECLSWAEFETILYKSLVTATSLSSQYFCTTIRLVHKERMTDMLHVSTNLMGTACFKHTLHQGGITETLQHLIMRNRRLAYSAVRIEDLHTEAVLRITNADIAFNAPLQFNSTIKAGPIYVGDMFNLYKYENQLYVMRLTGEEIRKHLEMSYDLWVNTMKSPEDHLLLLDTQTKGDQQRLGFKNLSFNFDSAAGIDYEVDVTKPDGEKVKILRMSNGQPFDEKKWYKVAVNSYRGNGGGELLTRGR